MDKELIYEKLPADIADRHVLLMDPILATGNSAVKAIQVSCSCFRECNIGCCERAMTHSDDAGYQILRLRVMPTHCSRRRLQVLWGTVAFRIFSQGIN